MLNGAAGPRGIGRRAAAGTPDCNAGFSASDSIEARDEPKPLPSNATRHGRNYTWAELMKRVWALDVMECPRCRSRMRMLAAIHPPDATRRILECLGLPSRSPPVAPAASELTAQIEAF